MAKMVNHRPADSVSKMSGERSRWLEEAAGDRLADIERSALVQVVDIGADASDRMAATAERFEIAVDQVEHTPFLLIGSVEQVVDKLERLATTSESVITSFATQKALRPVVDALAGR